MSSNFVPAIVGPTAVGKSAVAEGVALALGGEVVSADSMQVYRGMDIGTAKPRASERTVPHHCLDIVDPGAPYSAALFQRDARAAIADVRSRGLVPVIVGGTGLYVRAALDDMRFPKGQRVDPDRAALEELASRIGPAALHDRLAAVDPASAERIHPNNVRRVIRALELAQGGESYAEQAAGFAERRSHYPDLRIVGLTMERPTLYSRIDARVDAMMTQGLLAEVEALVEAGHRDALTAMQAIGYKELLPVLDGVAPLDDAVASIKQATRRYAKRQLAWFRADPRVRWLDVTGLSPEETVARTLDLLESSDHDDGPEGG